MKIPLSGHVLRAVHLIVALIEHTELGLARIQCSAQVVVVRDVEDAGHVTALVADAGGSLFAVGYELALSRFSSQEAIRRSTVSVSVGGFLGDVYMLYADMSPRYIIRANQYWSLPVGFKVSTSFLGKNATPVGTVGVTAGIRRHFGQRKSLK